MGKAGAPEGVGYRNIEVTNYTKCYNINRLSGYAVITPMNHGVYNNNMMGVVELCNIYNLVEPYNSILYILTKFVKSFEN